MVTRTWAELMVQSRLGMVGGLFVHTQTHLGFVASLNAFVQCGQSLGLGDLGGSAAVQFHNLLLS